MNINRNPLIRRRQKEQVWSRLMMMNAENLAVMVLTLNELYPKIFYPKGIQGYFENYIDTVALFDSFDKTGTKEHKIREYLAECPCLTDEVIERLIKHFGCKAVTALDKAIYGEPNLVGLLAENLTLMLLQLHGDYGFGEERMMRTVDAICAENYRDPLKLIDERFGVTPVEDKEQLRNEVKEIERVHRESRRSNRNAVAEEKEAARHLEEFRRLMKVGGVST